MAWRSSKRGPMADSNEWTGFLDKSVRLEGTLEFSGTFRLDAQIKGNILSSQTLMLGNDARVELVLAAVHAFGRLHDTALSTLLDAPMGFGTVCTVHEVPFHTSASVLAALLPTASHEPALEHEIALRPVLALPPVGCWDQVLPFHTSASSPDEL